MKFRKLIMLLVVALALFIGAQAALAEETEEASGVDLEVYALGGSVGEKGEDYSYDAGGHLHDLSANAIAEAGAFVVRKPDGDVVGGYGVTVGAGARYTAAEAYANGTVGYEDYNLHGAGTVSAGEAKAKADFTAGVVNGNLRVVAEGGAELNAFSAGGSAGVTIDGVDVNVYGGVKVGIGARGSVGYQDGKFKVDANLAVGLGFEVGFEVDVGAIEEKMEEAAVDAAKECVKNTVDAVATTIEVCQTCKAVVGAVEKTVGAAFDTVVNLIKFW